jgi:hypothetical protein
VGAFRLIADILPLPSERVKRDTHFYNNSKFGKNIQEYLTQRHKGTKDRALFVNSTRPLASGRASVLYYVFPLIFNEKSMKDTPSLLIPVISLCLCVIKFEIKSF